MLADPIASAVVVSLEVSVASTILATIPGVILGIALGIERFRGRDYVISFLYTALAFPTVVIGLLVYAVISRMGPLGPLGLMYSKSAIVIGQVILIFPIIATFTLSAVSRMEASLIVTAKSLGASRSMLYRTTARETWLGIIASVTGAFGRAISEVGISMILGGNIAGYTRTMTTLIALEHDKGQFEAAMILGFLLLAISLSINIAIASIQRRIGTRNA